MVCVFGVLCYVIFVYVRVWCGVCGVRCGLFLWCGFCVCGVVCVWCLC